MATSLTVWIVGRKSVIDEASANEFIEDCADMIGMGFHPDTKFGEYESDGDGGRKPMFDAAVAARLDDNMEAAINLVGDDAYELAEKWTHVCDDGCRSHGCPHGR